MIREGETLLMRIISIEAEEQRLGLSLKEVTTEEMNRWADQKGIDLPTVMEDSLESFENEPEDQEAVAATEV